MIDFNKFRNFLTDKNIYSENVGLYKKLIHKITNEITSEWMITKFANGADIADGNPIYSTFIENKKIAIRIIQTEIDINKPIFNAWINKNPFEMTDVDELVISMQLRMRRRCCATRWETAMTSSAASLNALARYGHSALDATVRPIRAAVASVPCRNRSVNAQYAEFQLSVWLSTGLSRVKHAA